MSSFFEIVDFEKECFFLISKSILSGEYISYEDFSNEIKEFIKTTEVDRNEGQSNILKKYYDVSDSLNNVLHEYSAFVSYAKEKFNTNSSGPRFNFYPSKTLQSESSMINQVTLTLRICRYEYKYPLLEEEINKFMVEYLNILDLREEKDENINSIIEILYFKCNFIIKRLNRKINFTKLGDLYKISPETLYVDFLQPLIDKQISFNPLNKKEKDILITDLESGTPKLESFIRLAWDMAKRKESNDLPEMKRLISKFEITHLIKTQGIQDKNSLSLKENYDIFSINSVYNFLQNCQFSIELSQKPFNLDFITKTINRIGQVQQGTLIKNFHPYKKSIDTIINFIEDKTDSSKNNEIVSFEKKLFFILDSFIFKFEEYIQWGKIHRFFPFQLSFDESIIPYKNLQIFIPSSFANVINYLELEDKLRGYKNKRDILANKYETFKSKLAIDELQSQFKKDRFNMLQTIILFAGIITFLFGTINIFSNNSEMNLTQLIINTSGLGVILVLFTSVSIAIAPLMTNMVNVDTLLKSRRFWIATVFFIVYAGTIFLNYKAVQDLHRSKKGHQLEELIRKSSDANIQLTENDSNYIFKIEK